MRNGRHHPGRLAVVVLAPESVFIPRMTKLWRQRRSVPIHPERTAMPAIVTAFHQMQEAGVVFRIVVIVHGEKIAQVIEHKFLWIAQPGGENFQTAPIWLAAEKRAGAVIRQLLPLVRFHPIPPISDAPIRPPIRSLHHPVKIMAVEGKPHAETAEHLLQRRLRFLRLRGRQSPHMRDAGQPYTAIRRAGHARRRAIHSLLKKAQHLTAIRLAIAIRVTHSHEAVRQLRVETHGRRPFSRMALHEGQSLLHTA